MVNKTLEDSLKLAVHGDKSAAVVFFESFLEGPLYVPERFQQKPLSDAPAYPDEFLNILGIKYQEDVFVPAFTNPINIQDWCGNKLKYREFGGEKLVDLMPETWWLTLNPHDEIGKEFSPWEIKQLKSGKESIPAIVAENFPPEFVETLDVKAIEEEHYPKLFEELRTHAKKISEIVRMCLLKEVGKDIDGETVETILLGVESSSEKLEELESIKEELKNTAQRNLIGAEQVKVYVGKSQSDSIALGMFKSTEPFYQFKKPGGIISKLLK